MQAISPVVLIVDDHEDSLAMYAFGLLAMGFQPVIAATAEDAFARACSIHPSVVVTDMTLAGSSGLDLTRRLREDVRTRNTGIIVLTGYAGAALRRQADEAGCDRFVEKPCMPDALAWAIRDVLANRRRGGIETHTQ
jgi:two-component system, cell cycle response regulator DivK